MDIQKTVLVGHLSRLTPAETLLLVKGDTVPLSELLKFTFIDLVLKQVLVVRESEMRADDRDPVRVHRYVQAGPNFRAHRPLAHELAFVNAFSRDPDFQILFRNLVKIGFQNARSERAYYPLIARSENLRYAISSSFLQRWLSQFSHTKQGAILREEVKSEIAALENSLPQIMRTDKSEGIELMKSIGGNLFLLRGIELKMLREFEAEVFSEVKKHTEAGGGCGAGCWVYYGAFSDSFDSSCSSDSSYGGGDSGGDSGCSGCGGCGGD